MITLPILIVDPDKKEVSLKDAILNKDNISMILPLKLGKNTPIQLKEFMMNRSHKNFCSVILNGQEVIVNKSLEEFNGLMK